MALLLTPFLILSVFGFALSLATHAAALLGLAPPLGSASWVLHIGIFVVWLPAVLVSNRIVAKLGRKSYWRAARCCCPAWMRWLTYACFAYTFVNFLLFISVVPPRGVALDGNTPSVVFRGFSGHWMAFYLAAASTLYSAIVVSRGDIARRCPNGHRASPSANFCDVCGKAIIEQEFSKS